MFDKYELGAILRSLARTNEAMRNSKYVGDDDPHLLKCEALEEKTKLILNGLPDDKRN